MNDIADCQDIYTGHVQHTAPFYGGGGGPGGWGGAMVIVPYTFYKHYGDKEILKKYYPNMLMYFDYLDAHSVNSLVMTEEAGGWCLVLTRGQKPYSHTLCEHLFLPENPYNGY